MRRFSGAAGSRPPGDHGHEDASTAFRDRRGGRALWKRVQKTAAMLKDQTLTGNRTVPEGHAKSPELVPERMRSASRR